MRRLPRAGPEQVSEVLPLLVPRAHPTMKLLLALALLALVGSCDFDNTGQYEIRDGMLCTVPTATEDANGGVSSTTCEVLP